MKILFDALVKDHPATVLIAVVISSVLGGGFVGFSHYTLASRDYVDNVVGEWGRQMRCDNSELKFQFTNSELFSLKENEVSQPNKDRRKRITDLENKLRQLEKVIDKCKAGY